MVSIPASLIATFGISLMGYVKLDGLLGLSLVVELSRRRNCSIEPNIHRPWKWGNKVRAAYDGAAEIGFTVTITLVIMVTFYQLLMSTD